MFHESIASYTIPIGLPNTARLGGCDLLSCVPFYRGSCSIITPAPRAVSVSRRASLILITASPLALVLNLVVPSDNLGVAWRGCAIAWAGTLVIVPLLLRRRAGTGVVVGAVAHVRLLRGRLGWLLLAGATTSGALRSTSVAVMDNDVCHATMTALGVVHALVVVVGFGELGNHIPCVEQTGDLLLVKIRNRAQSNWFEEMKQGGHSLT